MTKTLRLVTVNQDAAPVKRIKHSDGREYLIAPCVAAIEGVMNNILYAKEEMAAYIDSWNGRPLVISHPQDLDGKYISANTPEIFARSPGYFFNAHFDEGRLLGDWWIDVQKATAIGGDAERVLTGLEAGELFELSTGVFGDEEETSGEFNGVPYEMIIRNIRPDHVAILLDEVGACSNKDGCGAPRVNSNEAEPDVETPLAIVGKNEDKERTTVWRIFTDLLRKASGTDIQANADAVEGSLVEGSPEADGTKNNDSEVNIMSREEIIEGLLGLEKAFLTRAMLEAADDETLAAMWAEFSQPPEEPEPEAAAEEGEEPVLPQAEEVEQAFNLPPQMAEWIQMGEELGGVSAVKDSLLQFKERSDAEMTDMIGAITANTDQFSQDELKELSKPVLQKLAGLTRSMATVPNLIGRGMGVNFQTEDEWEEWTPKEAN